MRGMTAWQLRQARECPCDGSDELCACQNIDRMARADREVDAIIRETGKPEEGTQDMDIRQKVYDALRSYHMTNMTYESDPDLPYALVDLFSDGPDIGSGEKELFNLADWIASEIT